MSAAVFSGHDPETEPELVLFSWGANSYGQLCNGNKNDVLIPRPTESTCLSIKYITGGGGHTVVIAGNGNLYAAGWNNKGQLGFISESCEVPLLTCVPNVPKVQSVACGWNHTLILSDNGQLYGFGSNQYGQIGLGDHIKKVNEAYPVLVLNEKVTVSVAAGLRHSVSVTDCGRVWTFGANKSGQLGLGENKRKFVYTPQVVKALENTKVASVAAGSYHSVGISDRVGEVYCWGLNQHGQCGMDPCSQQNKICWSPTRIKGLLENENVLEIFSGWSHILAKTDSGKIFSWGRGDYGQLGLGSDVVSHGHCPNAQEILCLKGASQVYCGSEHNIAINCSGKAVCWGWNEHGICGTGNETNVHEPTIIPSLQEMQIDLVGCGGGTTFVVVSNNSRKISSLKL